ncbi:hypothetical protein DFH27DRAFT_637539 [Peziza echinospora]|nr:hypothetical protein DFH27DRAFT_637539 [Peziza echinospora]
MRFLGKNTRNSFIGICEDIQSLRIMILGLFIGVSVAVASGLTQQLTKAGDYTPSNPLGSLYKLSFTRTAITTNTLYIDGDEFLWKIDLRTAWRYEDPAWSNEAKPLGFEDHYDSIQHTLWDIGYGGFYTLNGGPSYIHGPPPGQPFGAPMVINGTGRYPKPKILRYDIITAGGNPAGSGVPLEI